MGYPSEIVLKGMLETKANEAPSGEVSAIGSVGPRQNPLKCSLSTMSDLPLPEARGLGLSKAIWQQDVAPGLRKRSSDPNPPVARPVWDAEPRFIGEIWGNRSIRSQLSGEVYGISFHHTRVASRQDRLFGQKSFFIVIVQKEEMC